VDNEPLVDKREPTELHHHDGHHARPARQSSLEAAVDVGDQGLGFRQAQAHRVIVVAVRLYLRYNLSYRDIEELLIEQDSVAERRIRCHRT